MYKNEMLESNPFDGIQSPKVEEKLPKALTPEDVENYYLLSQKHLLILEIRPFLSSFIHLD